MKSFYIHKHVQALKPYIPGLCSAEVKYVSLVIATVIAMTEDDLKILKTHRKSWKYYLISLVT